MIAPMGDAGQDPGEFDAGTGGARDARRFAGIRLAPGFLPRHVLIYLYAAFFTVGLFAFISFFQAWLLNVNLRLPEQLQGRTVSALKSSTWSARNFPWKGVAVAAAMIWWGAGAVTLTSFGVTRSNVRVQ